MVRDWKRGRGEGVREVISSSVLTWQVMGMIACPPVCQFRFRYLSKKGKKESESAR